jgi:hypothetical protein
MGDWRESYKTERMGRYAPLSTLLLLLIACGLFVLAMAAGRTVWGQQYWPRVDAKVVGVERSTNPNTQVGPRDSCTIHTAWVDPARKPHLANFTSSGVECLPGAVATLEIAYNPGHPQEAIRTRFPAWLTSLAVISFLLAVACLLPFFLKARQATVHRA